MFHGKDDFENKQLLTFQNALHATTNDSLVAFLLYGYTYNHYPPSIN